MLRFATGFFLGGALPSALALTSEYAPIRHRFFMLTAIPCGFTIGGALGGVVVAQLVTDIHKWRHVLFLGGILPLLLLPVLYFALPESVRFLLVRRAEPQRIRCILRRIAPRADLSDAMFVVPSTTATQSSSLHQLFARDFRIGTVLLWATFFMGLLLYYLLIHWLPIVISTSGASLHDAVLLTAMFPIGSTVGAVTLGVLMDRFNPYRVLMFAFVAGGVAVGLIGYVFSSQWALGAAILFAGFGNGGSVVGANALSAAFYPVTVRATGVSWALGIGRVGSIAGSMAGSFLLSLHWPLPVLFAVIAVPAMLAAVFMLMMGRLPSTRPSIPVASVARST
jgi:AAHS family 4-hydroxybenzoate transporter-like MFS transporter